MGLFASVLDLRQSSRPWGHLVALIGTAMAISAVTDASAYAAFPGRNGRIAYTNTIGEFDLARTRSSRSGPTALTGGA